MYLRAKRLALRVVSLDCQPGLNHVCHLSGRHSTDVTACTCSVGYSGDDGGPIASAQYMNNVCVCVCVCVHIHACMHTYIEREREREAAATRALVVDIEQVVDTPDIPPIKLTRQRSWSCRPSAILLPTYTYNADIRTRTGGPAGLALSGSFCRYKGTHIRLL